VSREKKMPPEWDTISYVISSQYRVVVLQHLAEGPATPSKIASESDKAIAHVSRALSGLREKALVELLVSEDRQKGRVYGITEQGTAVWQQIENENLV
jgi:DNA-binding MarR family transcriptional regulator